MQNAGLDEAQAGIKIAGRIINHLRYADDTTLMAESEEELKSLLMKVKKDTPVLLPGKSHGWRSLVGCRLWGCTESDTTEATCPGAPQDEAGLTRKFETSHMGGATCRTPPIPRSALEKDPIELPVGVGIGPSQPGQRLQRLRVPALGEQEARGVGSFSNAGK